MKVKYDISVLGMGHYKDRARTGIARVIENLAVTLSQRADIELSFSAYESLETWYKTRDYLRDQTSLSADCLSGPATRFGKTLSSLYRRSGLTSPAAHTSQNFFVKLHRRAQRMIGINAALATRWAGLSESAGQDILHTPFLAFPKVSDSRGPLSRFVTVYDLIPILYPQYFKFRERPRLEQLIQRIGPDDFVFAISESTKNDLCNYANIDPARVFVTPLAASARFTRCEDRGRIATTLAQYGIPDAPYVLSLCTLEPRKNIDQTIRSFFRLIEQESIRDLNLVLVGTRGWKFDRIFEELDRSPATARRVFTTGYVPDRDLAPIYSGALMFVYPSYYEGFGLPPLEAMQCGVPVVSSNTSSLPEVVGDAGILVAPDDTDAICHAMADLYRNDSLGRSLCLRGIQRASEFSWARCAEETVQGYKQAG